MCGPFTISLYNLANIAPRQTNMISIATTDVESVYRRILAAAREKDPKAPAGAEGAAVLSIGRVVSSNITGQRPEEMSADARIDIKSEQADAILQSIRGMGEESWPLPFQKIPDVANVATTAKTGIAKFTS